jgi:hypothetical protein
MGTDLSLRNPDGKRVARRDSSACRLAGSTVLYGAKELFDRRNPLTVLRNVVAYPCRHLFQDLCA